MMDLARIYWAYIGYIYIYMNYIYIMTIITIYIYIYILGLCIYIYYIYYNNMYSDSIYVYTYYITGWVKHGGLSHFKWISLGIFFVGFCGTKLTKQIPCSQGTGLWMGNATHSTIATMIIHNIWGTSITAINGGLKQCSNVGIALLRWCPSSIT